MSPPSELNGQLFQAKNVRQLLTHAHTVSGSNSNFVPGILRSTSSCEPRRSSAYREDVRWRRARLLVFLNIYISTRILHIFTTTGDLDVCKRMTLVASQTIAMGALYVRCAIYGEARIVTAHHA